MKILFLTRHFGCLRNFERPILQLAARGHQLRLIAHVDDMLGGQAMVERWASATPAITIGRVPAMPSSAEDGLARRLVRRSSRGKPWSEGGCSQLDSASEGGPTRRSSPVNSASEGGPARRSSPANFASEGGARLRLMIDYLRYLEPAYRDAPGLVERAVERTPQAILSATRPTLARIMPVRRAMRRFLLWMERSLPLRPEVIDFLRAEAPDVVLLTPLISLGSEELDYLDGVQAIGLRSVFCVWSWDNLSSKALLRQPPDLVTVWNDVQKREAVELHGVPADRVLVTGAQSFDHWFNRRPVRSRDSFCARVNLPSDRPLLLWVCSALFQGSPSEAALVLEWIKHVRASTDPRLRDAAILIRPHPSRQRQWADADLSTLGPVSVWGANPVDDESQEDYFESLQYASVVVGLNTSAFLEAAVVGRPVMTVLLPDFFENQEGTLHFPYLLNVAGGLLDVARSLPEHVSNLESMLRSPAAAEARSRRFVEAFVRPRGLNIEASTLLVEAVEQVGRLGPASVRRAPPFGRLARRMFDAAARRFRPEDPECLWLAPREAVQLRARAQRLAEQQAHREASLARRLAEKTRRMEEKAERIREKRRAQDLERAASGRDLSR